MKYRIIVLIIIIISLGQILISYIENTSRTQARTHTRTHARAPRTHTHKLLMQKLSFYGVQNTSLNLFKSYLSERSQFVSIGGTSSPLRTINTGVPQGSILGPLLFIIYINDLHMASDKLNYILYADDTTLIGNISNFKSSICSAVLLTI